MRPETKIQGALAFLGVPFVLFVLWQPNAKWPNPFRPAQPPHSGKAADR